MGTMGLSAQARNPRGNPQIGQRVALAPLKAAPEADLAGFTSWRGLSGRRYIVSVYHPASVPDYGDAVLIAVGRDRQGGRRILAVGTGSPEPLAAIAGCVEIHVHLLARDVGEKAQLLADLALPALKRLNREERLPSAA